MSVTALVVGAGPSGLAAAMQLATWCETIVVIDARPRGAVTRAGEHLPPDALSSLTLLGLDDLLDDPNHTLSSGVCSAWGESDVAERDYFFSPAGHGINLRREIFDEALTQRCEQFGVQFKFDTRLSSLEINPEGYRATLREGADMTDIHTDIVLDASGRNARAARQLGAKFTRTDNLLGIVGRIKCSKPSADAGRLHIQSVQDGWWYTVQFSDGLVIGTYMTDTTIVKQHEQGALGLWRERLSENKAVHMFTSTGDWPRPGPGLIPEHLDVYDASTQILDQMESDTFLAIGDAAIAFDPLSSWGITKGMLDGFAGANALERQLGGEHLAIADHRSKQYQDFQHYLDSRKNVYSAEQRWPKAPFWSSRQTSYELH